jgi:hypothetical protein
MVKYLNFHNSSFASRYFFNVNGKAIVWGTPCFKHFFILLEWRQLMHTHTHTHLCNFFSLYLSPSPSSSWAHFSKSISKSSGNVHMKKTRVITIIDTTQKSPENPKGQRVGYLSMQKSVTTDWQTQIGKDQVTSKRCSGLPKIALAR